MTSAQSNTIEGLITVTPNADLTGKEGFLARIVNSSGVAKADLPSAITQQCLYVIEQGATTSGKAELRPLVSGRQVRIKAKGAGNPGDKAVPATTGDFGKIRADATGLGGGSSALIGYFEEAFVDGQLALVRYCPEVSITLTT